MVYISFFFFFRNYVTREKEGKKTGRMEEKVEGGNVEGKTERKEREKDLLQRRTMYTS